MANDTLTATSAAKYRVLIVFKNNTATGFKIKPANDKFVELAASYCS